MRIILSISRCFSNDFFFGTTHNTHWRIIVEDFPTKFIFHLPVKIFFLYLKNQIDYQKRSKRSLEIKFTDAPLLPVRTLEIEAAPLLTRRTLEICRVVVPPICMKPGVPLQFNLDNTFKEKILESTQKKNLYKPKFAD